MKDGTTMIKGMYSDVWNVLEQRLNFTTVVSKMSRMRMRALINKGLPNKDYDLALTGNSLTYSRSKNFDFSFSIVPTSLRIFYVKSTAGSSNWFVYLKSFVYESWIGIIITTSIAFLSYLVLQLISTKVKKTLS